MGFVGDLNAYYEGDPVVLAPSAARTTSASGTPQATGHFVVIRLNLVVTAVTGTTPSMTVIIETSMDATNWNQVGTFPAVTTTGTTRRSVGGLDRFVRVSWTITGTTPSFTFAVSGELVG